MSSKITDVYDALKARMSALFPDHKRLTDPYNVEQNVEAVLNQAWGIQIAAGDNAGLHSTCLLSINRTIIVVLTRKFYATELNRGNKETAEKLLLEDHYTLIKDLEGDPTLGDSDAVAKFGWVSDGGMESIFSDKQNYLKILSTFQATYFEELT